MKFSEYTYTRPDLEHIKTSFGELLKGFEADEFSGRAERIHGQDQCTAQ